MKSKKTTLLTPELIQKFLKRKRFSGVVAFLLSLQNKSGRQDFYTFLSKHGCDVQAGYTSSVLFHGSNILTASLNKHRSVGTSGHKEKESLVYSTNDPNYALFLAVLNLKNGGAGVVAEKGRQTKLTIDFDFVNGTSKLQPGYIHIVPASTFTASSNREYVSSEEVEVLFSLRVEPGDLTVPIVIR